MSGDSKSGARAVAPMCGVSVSGIMVYLWPSICLIRGNITTTSLHHVLVRDKSATGEVPVFIILQISQHSVGLGTPPAIFYTLVLSAQLINVIFKIITMTSYRCCHFTPAGILNTIIQ